MIMKKIYLQPETEILYLNNVEMIAISLIDDTPATGDDALVREDNNWDIWDEEE